MIVRQTSIEAYQQIEAEGLLSAMRFKVYSALFHHGPATAAELSSTFPRSKGGRGEAGNVHARLTELEERGVARELGERKCTVTSRNVIVWDVTDQLPRDPKKGVKRLTRNELEVRFRALSAQAARVLDMVEARWPEWKKTLKPPSYQNFVEALQRLETLVGRGMEP